MSTKALTKTLFPGDFSAALPFLEWPPVFSFKDKLHKFS
jgi:hypothetical protein